MTAKFDHKVTALTALLQGEGRSPLEVDEIFYLREHFSSWMTLFEIAGLLWEYRFQKFLRELLTLCQDGNIDELNALAKAFYLKNKSPIDASREFKAITAKRRKESNESVENTSENKL